MATAARIDASERIVRQAFGEAAALIGIKELVAVADITGGSEERILSGFRNPQVVGFQQTVARYASEG